VKEFKRGQVYEDWINNHNYVIIWVSETHIKAIRLDSYTEFVARKRYFEPDTYVRDLTPVEMILL
jgi:hypothetical protein